MVPLYYIESVVPSGSTNLQACLEPLSKTHNVLAFEFKPKEPDNYSSTAEYLQHRLDQAIEFAVSQKHDNAIIIATGNFLDVGDGVPGALTEFAWRSKAFSAGDIYIQTNIIVHWVRARKSMFFKGCRTGIKNYEPDWTNPFLEAWFDAKVCVERLLTIASELFPPLEADLGLKSKDVPFTKDVPLHIYCVESALPCSAFKLREKLASFSATWDFVCTEFAPPGLDVYSSREAFMNHRVTQAFDAAAVCGHENVIVVAAGHFLEDSTRVPGAWSHIAWGSTPMRKLLCLDDLSHLTQIVLGLGKTRTTISFEGFHTVSPWDSTEYGEAGLLVTSQEAWHNAEGCIRRSLLRLATDRAFGCLGYLSNSRVASSKHHLDSTLLSSTLVQVYACKPLVG